MGEPIGSLVFNSVNTIMAQRSPDYPCSQGAEIF